MTQARPGPGHQRSYIMLRVCEARAETVRSCSDLATPEPCYSRCCEPWQAFHHHSATCRYAKSRHQDSLARSDKNILNLQNISVVQYAKLAKTKNIYDVKKYLTPADGRAKLVAKNCRVEIVVETRPEAQETNSIQLKSCPQLTRPESN